MDNYGTTKQNGGDDGDFYKKGMEAEARNNFKGEQKNAGKE
jgi:hypothetical protein